MPGVKVTSKLDSNGNTRIQFVGSMDEHSDYSSVNSYSFTDEVVLDFDGITHINSTGIRIWIQFVDDLPERRYTLINLSKPFVDQVNMVKGFVPKNHTVRSFKVPFYCEECDQDATATLVMDRDYKYENDELSMTVPNNSCDKPNCEMEVDVVDRYFDFLKKK